MNDLLALKNVVLVLVLFGAMMLGLGALVARGYTEHLVPPPEMVAEQFLRALEARNYAAPRDQISAELRQQFDVAALQARARAIEASDHAIEQAHGRDAQISQLTALASLAVTLQGGEVRIAEFPLRQEHGLWKIASIEPLQILTTR